MTVLQRIGFTGMRGDWQAYAKWLGLRHQRRIWDELMSNAMATLIELIISSTATRREVREQGTLIVGTEENRFEGSVEDNNDDDGGDDIDNSSSSSSGSSGEEQEDEDNTIGDDKDKDTEQQVQERLQMQVQRSKKTTGLQKVYRFKEKLQGWVRCCTVCKASNGVIDKEHSWKECRRHGNLLRDFRTWMFCMEELRPDRRSGKKNGCWGCCLPVQICKGWSQEEGRFDSDGQVRAGDGWIRRFEGGVEGECQWEGLAVSVAVSLLFFGQEEVRRWVDADERFMYRVRERQELERERGGVGEDEGKMEVLAEFLLEQEEWEGLEGSRVGSNVMCEMIWIFG